MSDLDQNAATGLAAFAKNLKEKAAAQGATPSAAVPQNTETPTPSPVQTVEQPAKTEKEPVAQQPVTQVTPDPKTELSTEPSPQETIVEAWDKDLFSTSTAPVDEPLTIENLSSALKLDGVKSKDDLVQTFTKQQAKIKELEEAQTSFVSDLDDEFKEIFKIAKEKGDWKSHLAASMVDYSKIDPVQLFEQEIDRIHGFGTPSYNKEAADAALAEVPDSIKRIQGEQMKQNLIQRSQLRRQEIARQAEERKSKFNRDLAEASRNLSKTLSPEKVGITLEAKHSDYIYEGIRNGKLIEKHFGKIDLSGVDAAKLSRTIALAEWGEQIASHQSKQGYVKGQKDLLSKAQNVQLNTPPIPPSPITETKPKSAAEKIAAHVGALKTPGSL